MVASVTVLGCWPCRSGGWKGSGGISWPAWRPLRWQCLWVLLPSLEASERTSFLPPLPGAQVKTSDPPVPSDDDTTVACSFLKALLGGCSSGGGSGGGSVSTHAFWSASSWRLRRRRRRSSGGATADGRGIVGSLRHQARGAQGETPDLGLPDRMMMAFYRFPFWGHRFGASAGWRDGGAVLHLTH